MEKLAPEKRRNIQTTRAVQVPNPAAKKDLHFPGPVQFSAAVKLN
jgi:hypothetical protein